MSESFGRDEDDRQQGTILRWLPMRLCSTCDGSGVLEAQGQEREEQEHDLGEHICSAEAQQVSSAIAEILPASDLQRLMTLREELFAAIATSLAEDGHCKHYEGAFTIRLPNYFQQIGARAALHAGSDDDAWRISLDCYLIGPHRHYDWIGSSFTEALAKAEIDVRAWINGDDESRHFEEL